MMEKPIQRGKKGDDPNELECRRDGFERLEFGADKASFIGREILPVFFGQVFTPAVFQFENSNRVFSRSEFFTCQVVPVYKRLNGSAIPVLGKKTVGRRRFVCFVCLEPFRVMLEIFNSEILFAVAVVKQ
ncbi:MAG: hypothetical protein LBT26_02245 [Clostridiales Family XIII bacterium]|nr:hypothetical protein [Clostridiales Family XIII bacterium]